ncbi:hypothetical protein [uncultured Eubacterium sp.]|uniref:hypothetical protein n=1 Tax=uncultured Eubacterium sp. TaxID=165185 RepID=UPI000EDAB6F0|nr:hypothetical protein [uncultured Eubacterium sp.]HAH18555.1 hypothetical protein [Eubacterium sp.]
MAETKKNDLMIMKKIKISIFMFICALVLCSFTNAESAYAGETYVINSGDAKEAKHVHKVLYKGKPITLKLKGNKALAIGRVNSLAVNLAKANKYGVCSKLSVENIKVNKKTITIKFTKENAKQYREVILLLKKMKKFYLNKNVKSLKSKLKYSENYDKYDFRKSEDNSAIPEPGTYSEGDKFEIYNLYYGDDNSLLSITYFVDKGYYDLADYGNYSDDFENGKYLECLKDIKNYYYTTGSNAKHYKVDQAYIDRIKSELETANALVDEKVKTDKASIDNLSEDAVKYLKDKSLKDEYIACSRIKNNEFCDVSDALKIYMISKCFVYDDGVKENYNPFIKYDLIYSGSAGGVVYHYDRNPNKYYFKDYFYEGNDRFFRTQKNGKVSTVLKKLRKGTLKGVCHDYTTAQGYIYSLLNIEHYYGYSKIANHAISIVKAKNTDGKTFWVYQNYNMLGDADKTVMIDGLCLKGKQYSAIGSKKKKQKIIKKSKFTMSDIN